jgi:hypothetical protein
LALKANEEEEEEEKNNIDACLPLENRRVIIRMLKDTKYYQQQDQSKLENQSKQKYIR